MIGGSSPAAYHRAIAHGHGWYGNGQSPSDLAKHLEALHQAAGETERPAWLGRLEISFLPLAPDVSPGTALQYTDLGADRLVLYPPSLDDPAEVEAFLRHHAGLLHLPGLAGPRCRNGQPGEQIRAGVVGASIGSHNQPGRRAQLGVTGPALGLAGLFTVTANNNGLMGAAINALVAAQRLWIAAASITLVYRRPHITSASISQ